MDKILIVKDNLTRSIYEKDAKKWATRGYKRVEDPAKAPAKAKPRAKAE